MLKYVACILLSLAVWNNPVKAETNEIYAPDDIVVQTGAYDGFLAIGVGKQFTSYYNMDLIYGYIPPEIGSTTVHSMSWKHSFSLFDTSIYGNKLAGNSGAGLIWGWDKDLFEQLPKKYPSRYYSPTAFRFTAFGNIQYSLKENHKIYGEYSFTDIAIKSYIENFNDSPRRNIGTYGIGYRFSL